MPDGPSSVHVETPDDSTPCTQARSRSNRGCCDLVGCLHGIGRHDIGRHGIGRGDVGARYGFEARVVWLRFVRGDRLSQNLDSEG